MKLSKLTFVSVAAALLLSITLQAKNEIKKAYIFGFASSFNDSTVYITDIHEVDSAWFNTKTHFLVSRENYSYQLRDYLSGLGEEHRTCMVEYSTNLKDLQKKWNKLSDRYIKEQKTKNNQKQTNSLPPYQVKTIGKDKFAFTSVAPLEEVDNEEVDKPTKKVKAKKAMKEQKNNQ